jgi:hypothetical protein
VSSRQVAYAQQRRSTRLDQAVPLAVQGVGAYREPYREQVSTLSISCHGCAYQSKYEVIQGEVVYLDVRPPDDGPSRTSSQARVKWVQSLGNKGGFQVAVELEVAGNIWGITSPPEDWFPVRVPIVSDPATSGRELRVVARTDQQLGPATNGGSGRASQIERSDTSAPSSLAQLMAGLGEQIQVMASEAASTALTDQKNRMLEEFRLQLRDEAIRTMQAMISASREDFNRRALKEVNEAHQAGARANYERWMKRIEQDMESARQHMMVQAKEVSQRLDGMAASTIERVQRNMEASRTEAVDRFVSRLRDQVAPLIAEAKDTLQTLTTSETNLKTESQAIYAGLESQIVSSANSSLAKVHEELEKNSAAVAVKTGETLVKLSEDLEKAARDNLQSLLVSMGRQVTKALEQRTAEISLEFSTGLEGYTRNYLETIGKAIAEIPVNALKGSTE